MNGLFARILSRKGRTVLIGAIPLIFEWSPFGVYLAIISVDPPIPLTLRRLKAFVLSFKVIVKLEISAMVSLSLSLHAEKKFMKWAGSYLIRNFF